MQKANVKFKMLLFTMVFIGYFCAAFQVFGASYYVSSSLGLDSNDGKSAAAPWKTIDKVNSTVFVSSDHILFRSNEKFPGQINLNQSGLTLGSYGAGSKPIITGAQLLTGWIAHPTPQGSFYVAQASARVKNLFANGVQMTLARYPNSGFMRVVGKTTTSPPDTIPTLTADELNHKKDFFKDANIRIRTKDWSFEIRTVSSSIGNAITLQSETSHPDVVGWGFYLDNVLAALDAPGEWYCDPATNLVYFWAPGGVNPNTMTVYGSTTDYGVNSSQNNITVQGLEFWHQTVAALRFSGSASHIRLLSNTISGGLKNGIHFDGTSANCTVDGNTLHDINSEGIVFLNTNNSVVSNNVLQNIGLVQGYGKSAFGGMMGISLYGRGTANKIIENTIDNVGYIGIFMLGTENLIENNVITNTMLKLADGGAIYTSNASGRTYNNTIRGNHISNVVGNLEGGLVGNTWKISNGIYLDLASRDTIVDRNTISHVASSCMFIQFDDTRITLTNNILSDCGNSGMGGSFLHLDQHSEATDATYGDHVVTGNRFYPANSTQRMIFFGDNVHKDQPTPPGTFDCNYYANPYYNSKPFKTCSYPDGIQTCVGHSFTEWQQSTGLDEKSFEYYSLANAIYILQILSGKDPSTSITACDVNGDQRLGLAEVVNILDQISQ